MKGVEKQGQRDGQNEKRTDAGTKRQTKWKKTDKKEAWTKRRTE